MYVYIYTHAYIHTYIYTHTHKVPHKFTNSITILKSHTANALSDSIMCITHESKPFATLFYLTHGPRPYFIPAPVKIELM